MDFHSLPRRDLQALCKRNAIRANMSNAAMADALRSLQSVVGIDEIPTVPPPGMSAARSAAEEVARGEQWHDCPLPCVGRSRSQAKTGDAALTPDTLQSSQQNVAERDATAPLDSEAVATGNRRTRRSRRSKLKMVSDQKEEAAAAEQKEPIIEQKMIEKKSAAGEEHSGCPLPCGGRGRATRSTAVAHKTEDSTPVPDTLQRTVKMEARDAAVPVQIEEVSTGKRRTRRSRRLKANVALDKKEEEASACTAPIADSSDAAIGPAVISDKSCDDPKQEAGMDEEATKPQEDEMNPSIYSRKRRTRRPRRAKVKMALDKKEEVAAAARMELIADSPDVILGSDVVLDKTCDDFKEEKVSLVEVGATKFEEGIVDELEPTSTVQKSPSLAAMKDTPIRCVLSMEDSRGPVIEMA